MLDWIHIRIEQMLKMLVSVLKLCWFRLVELLNFWSVVLRDNRRVCFDDCGHCDWDRAKDEKE